MGMSYAEQASVEKQERELTRAENAVEGNLEGNKGKTTFIPRKMKRRIKLKIADE